MLLELCNVAVVTYVPWKFVPQSGLTLGTSSSNPPAERSERGGVWRRSSAARYSGVPLYMALCTSIILCRIILRCRSQVAKLRVRVTGQLLYFDPARVVVDDDDIVILLVVEDIHGDFFPRSSG